MRGIEGEQVLLRIILSESRTSDRAPLFRRLLEMLRSEGLAGTTVLKGVAGFGHDRRVHSLVIEVVDTPERIDRVLPKVDALMGDGGVVMTERARVMRYAPLPPGTTLP
jgi:PII-like signaling protein